MASLLMSGDAFGTIKANSAPAVVNELLDWSKKVMIVQLLQEDGRLCDLYCGRGADIRLFASGKVGGYVGIDSSASAIEAAKENWLKQGTPFEAEFREIDPCLSNLSARISLDSLSFEGVSCQGHVQDAFLTETTMRSFLTNVANLLKPGGYFFGTCPDSSIIWVKAQKALQQALQHGQIGPIPKVASKSFQIIFENDRFTTFGCEYSFSLEDGMPAQRQLLVHFPSLIRFAAEVGLEFIDISNLEDFYEYNKSSFSDLLQLPTSTDGKKRIPGYAKELMSIYATFVFRKFDHIIVPPEKSPLPKFEAVAAPEGAVSDLSDGEGVRENSFAVHEGSPEAHIPSPPKQAVSPLREQDALVESSPPTEKKRKRLRKVQNEAEKANTELLETVAQKTDTEAVGEAPREVAGKTRRGRLRKAGAVLEAREELTPKEEKVAEAKNEDKASTQSVGSASVQHTGAEKAATKKGLAVKKSLKKGGLRVDAIKAEQGKRGASESPRAGDTPRRAEGVAILALAAPDETTFRKPKRAGKKEDVLKEDGRKRKGEAQVEAATEELGPSQAEPVKEPKVKSAKAKSKAKKQVYKESKYGPDPSFKPAQEDFALPEAWFASGKDRRKMSIKLPSEEGAPEKVIEARIDDLGVRLARAASIEREIEAAQKEAHKKGESEFVAGDVGKKRKGKKLGVGQKSTLGETQEVPRELVIPGAEKREENDATERNVEGAEVLQGEPLEGEQVSDEKDVPAKMSKKGKGKAGSKGGKKWPVDGVRLKLDEQEATDTKEPRGKLGPPLAGDGQFGGEAEKRPNRRNSLRSAGDLEERASDPNAVPDAFESGGQETEAPPVVVYKKRLKKKGTKLEIALPQEGQENQLDSRGDEMGAEAIGGSAKSDVVGRLEARDPAATADAGPIRDAGPIGDAGPKLLRRVSTRRGAGEQSELLKIDMDLPSPEYKKRKGQRGRKEDETKALPESRPAERETDVENKAGGAQASEAAERESELPVAEKMEAGQKEEKEQVEVENVQREGGDQETEAAEREGGVQQPIDEKMDAGWKEEQKREEGKSDQQEEDAKAEGKFKKTRQESLIGVATAGETEAVEKRSGLEQPGEETSGVAQAEADGEEEPAEGTPFETEAGAASGIDDKEQAAEEGAAEVSGEAASKDDEKEQVAKEVAVKAQAEAATALDEKGLSAEAINADAQAAPESNLGKTGQRTEEVTAGAQAEAANEQDENGQRGAKVAAQVQAEATSTGQSGIESDGKAQQELVASGPSAGTPESGGAHPSRELRRRNSARKGKS